MNAVTDDPPYQRHSDTSRAAAEAIKPKRVSLRQRVLDAIRTNGLYGMTDEEIQAATGISPNTARPRRVELVAAGLVVDLGERRPTASGKMSVVWGSQDSGSGR